MTPLRSAAFARTLRRKARAARNAGQYESAARLSRMAVTVQAFALVSDFGGGR